MKIEKISDTQIRCTLSHNDLAERELKISELAYGTEKAKDFFHEMIEQAADEFGFEADEAPLMIEAIPVSSDCVVLVITKVDDPEDIDAKFSKFAPSDNSSDILELPKPEEGDVPDFKKLLDDNFIPITETLQAEGKVPAEDKPVEKLVRIYAFDSWAQTADAIANIDTNLEADTCFLKDAKGTYYLVLQTEAENKKDFIRTCNTLSEYGRIVKSNYATLPYLMEHCNIIIKSNALNILSEF